MDPTHLPTRAATATDTAERASAPAAKRATRGGRPSREDALKLGARILGAATELFLTQGYGETSIEAVAARAGISKRTFYHRYADKPALFAAVVHAIIARIRPPADVPLVVGATPRDILRRLAGFILDAALSPSALALHRLVVAESARFPELARAVHDSDGEREARSLLGEVLRAALPPTILARPETAIRFAAEQFLHMVLAIPQRRALGLGTPMSREELDAWADEVVRLFLEGYPSFAAEPQAGAC